MKRKMNQQDWSIVAEIELSYKTKIKTSEMLQVIYVKDCYMAFKQTWDTNKIEFVEQFKVMLLNRSSRVLGIYEVSTGTTNRCPIEPKQIFCAAIKANAASIVICHNHPSGNLKPSRQDEIITKKLVGCGILLDIPVKDHLIISSEGYCSLAEEGLL